MKEVVPPPPITMREFVRVQPSEKEPVLVSICQDNGCIIKATATDLSEAGIGVILKKGDA